MTSHTTVRLADTLRQRLQKQAEGQGTTSAALLRRYVVEGLRRDERKQTAAPAAEGGVFE